MINLIKLNLNIKYFCDYKKKCFLINKKIKIKLIINNKNINKKLIKLNKYNFDKLIKLKFIKNFKLFNYNNFFKLNIKLSF